jgi:hypothetical protein
MSKDTESSAVATAAPITTEITAIAILDFLLIIDFLNSLKNN